VNELPDVNVLFALNNPNHAGFISADHWFNNSDIVAVTPITQTGLIRLLINPEAALQNVSSDEAVVICEATTKAPGVEFWPDTLSKSGNPLGEFRYALQGYRQITDLHLLALAADHDGRLVTFDTRIEAALKPKHRKYVRTLKTQPVRSK
jgi:uncharacterized protein